MKLTANNICFTLCVISFAEDTIAVSIDYLEAVKIEDEPKAENQTILPPKKNIDEIYHQTRTTTDNNELKLRFLKRKFFLTPEYETSSTSPKPTVKPTPTVYKDPFNLLHGYDYNYEVLSPDKELFSKSTDYMEKQSALRTRMEEQFTEDIQNQNSTNSTDDKNIHYEIFNLEPAAMLTKLKKTVNHDPNLFTWYVPEKYPCWELPILYGEVVERPNRSDVFLIHPIRLKNVVFDSMEENFGAEDYFDNSRFNKWCAMPPCYGDHTLCLFPHTANAKICDEDYVVRVPTTYEQIALVNTLNSMRNHVAKGSEHEYPHLPAAANMKQVMYDSDLENMAKRWLKQCLPGPAPCISLDWDIVSQLECTKSADVCCKNKDPTIKCTPLEECFVHPVIGCLHSWFWSAGGSLSETDVKCGHIEVWSYNLAQILWANTDKVGCAYGERSDGDVRVICNFCPGAPFSIETKFYCGLIPHKDSRDVLDPGNITDIEYLRKILNMDLKPVKSQENLIGAVSSKEDIEKRVLQEDSLKKMWGVDSLHSIYKERWIRKKISRFSNGTMGFTARLVTRYKFREETEARCDTNEPVYERGEPGAMCAETGRKYHALCYEFCNTIPSYRIAALIAALVLFCLILYDLFSSVMRQLHS